MSSAKKYPTFINNSGLPIKVETWQTDMPGLASFNSFLVKPGEQIIISSTTHEWILQNYLDREMSAEWTSIGLQTGCEIGKFRDEPCVQGKYSWMYNDHFPLDIVYDKEKNTATFVKK